MCEPECPNEAITLGNDIYEISAEKCTECVGHYDEAQCIKVCPIDCIESDPEFIENEQTLLEKFNRIYQIT